MTDPYDHAALSLPAGTHDAISAFWNNFAANEAGLNALFTTGKSTTGPAEVMIALRDVSPDLMWEFGPAETGHKVVITAEWNHDHRALARAVVNSAPPLRHFTPAGARGPKPPQAIQRPFEATKAGRPRQPYGAQPLETRQQLLFDIAGNADREHERVGIITYVASDERFAYLDLALTDVTRGLACAADALRGNEIAEPATVHFLDPGLAAHDMPLRDAAMTPH